MARISTIWDYELKEEVFRLTGDKGYLHKTQTTLKEEKRRKTGYDDLKAYCLVEFYVDVNQDVGNSYITIYDNGKAIPFTISNVQYTQYTWTDSTTMKKIAVKLGYDVEHNITARYMGNKYGLPSVSVNVPIFETLPNKYRAKLVATCETLQFNTSTVEIPIRLYSLNDNHEGFIHTADKEVTVYKDNRYLSSTTLHAIQGEEYVDGTITINNLTDGIHNLYFLFDGDEDNAYCEMYLQIKVGYQVELTSFPSATVYCNTDRYDDWNVLKVKVFDWDGMPIVGEDVTATGVNPLTATTNADGIATFIEDEVHNFVATYQNSSSSPKSIPCLHASMVENAVSPQYMAEGVTNNVSVKLSDSTWSYGLGVLTNIPVYLSDLTNTYKSSLDANGVASFDYTNTRETDVTLTSQIGDVTTQSTHEVVSQYWNPVRGEEINKAFTMIKGDLIEVPTGVKIKPDNTGTAIIGFGEGTTGFGAYEITFDNYQEVKNVQLAPGRWRNSNGYISWYFHPNFNGKEVYMGKRYPFTLKRWKDAQNVWHYGVWQGSRSLLGTPTANEVGEPAMRLVFRKTTESVIINNIKIKKIR